MGGITRGVTQVQMHYHGVYEKLHGLQQLRHDKIESQTRSICKLIATPIPIVTYSLCQLVHDLYAAALVNA